MVIIRPESDEHARGVRVVEERAFGRPAEADLVERLHRRGKAAIALVALDEDEVIGHVLFSPVRVGEGPDALEILGMGPVAVLPERQRQGIGSRLIRAGLEECRQIGAPAVVVLGDPRYYTRFGFQPAARFGIRFSDASVPADAFMVMELRKGILEGRGGVAYYEPEFNTI